VLSICKVDIFDWNPEEYNVGNQHNEILRLLWQTWHHIKAFYIQSHFMKLRIRENTIRLRLKQNEVEKLASGESIVEQTCFPDSVLTYRLDVSDDGQFSASFQDGNLTIRLPEPDITHWAENDEVSIVAEQTLGSSDVLSLLVEKDFKCLVPGHHRLNEDDADTYPHPDADTGHRC
jgi:hypothetical protein